MARTVGIGVLVGAIIGGSVAFAMWRTQRARDGLAAACRPMACSDLGSQPASNFTLTDQRGRSVSLSSLRGRVVVLEFMDPVCKDICPVVSAEFLHADRLLGSQAAHAAFVAVNVNQYRETVADVRSFTSKQGLGSTSNWYFLTGTTSALRSVWSHWAVAVVPNPNGDVVHTSVMYFLDPSGHTRLVVFPTKSKAAIGPWGASIADTVRHLAGV
jgi:cytochrome oxidase Cu insertion factor (SCO1/SenC/PrrC family)